MTDPISVPIIELEPTGGFAAPPATATSPSAGTSTVSVGHRVDAGDDPNAPLLEVRNLSVEFKTDDGIVKAVQNVSYTLLEGETLGIVGESGSGKTVTSLAVLGLLPKKAKVTGEVLFRGRNLVTMSEREMQSIRGRRIAMIFQDALASLNPVFKVGDQIAEAINVHADGKIGTDDERVLELLDRARRDHPGPGARGAGAHPGPHQFSRPADHP
jgi:peptide/nickel transport system ATP-binding protein